MATTTPSAVLVPVAPVFTNSERLALAGFLAGYSGLTRQAYKLGLRQFASWCQQHQLHLFGQAARSIAGLEAQLLAAKPRTWQRGLPSGAGTGTARLGPDPSPARDGWIGGPSSALQPGGYCLRHHSTY
jgi:hypothetical protein